jgi:hypothetical protein
MNMERAIKILGFILLLGASCSEEVTPKPFTFSKFFTGENNKTWKVKFWEETLDGKVIDKFNVGCVSDDQYIFYANSEKRMDVKSGTSKCFNPAEPSLTTDTWSYQSGSATLTMLFPIFADFPLPFIVRDVDKNNLVIEIFFDTNASYRIHFDATHEE